MELFFSNEMLMAYVEKITMQKITIDHSKNESGAFIQVQKWFIAFKNDFVICILNRKPFEFRIQEFLNSAVSNDGRILLALASLIGCGQGD